MGRILTVAFIVGAGVISAPQSKPVHPATRSDYVGDAKCLTCHTGEDSYLQTAHHLTSRLSSNESVLGHFSDSRNVLATSNPDMLYRMDATGTGFYVSSVQNPMGDALVRRERIDLVIGSGRKGQTYVYWNGNRLFELPVSYWTELDNWVSSPGYRSDIAEFSRPVPGRCLECHASYFEAQPGSAPANAYNKMNFILGVACERCHGPGQKHAQNRESQVQKRTKFEETIVNPAKLTRKRQMDVCALCHAGIGSVPLAPAFSYVPGAALENYMVLQRPDPTATIDVHGSQVALLERSRCFQSSQMTCSTCHNVHVSQRKAEEFSTHCLSCHKPESCGLHAKLGSKIADKCIDCHMPQQPSNTIVADANGRKVSPLVRTHWIKVYSSLTALD